MSILIAAPNFGTPGPRELQKQLDGGIVAENLNLLLVSVPNNKSIYERIVFATDGITHPEQTVVQSRGMTTSFTFKSTSFAAHD